MAVEWQSTGSQTATDYYIVYNQFKRKTNLEKTNVSSKAVFQFKNQLNRKSVSILCIGTDRSEQTVQTQIGLLHKEQSDNGLHCSPFHLHYFGHITAL